MTIEEFIQLVASHGIQLNEHQLAQYQRYFELLVDWNQRVNLTAITDQSEVYLKHFYDSMMPLWQTDLDFEGKRLVDIGAGAGFPSIPMLIAEPSMHVTIIDSLNKRIQFIDTLTEELGLVSQVQALHGRAEDFGQDPQYRGQFDIATARAVAALDVLSEYCLPFVKKGGYFIALKGAKAEAELDDAEKAIQVLGAKVESYQSTQLPGEDSERALIVIKKTLDTPKKYPRRAGKPSKQPIQ